METTRDNDGRIFVDRNGDNFFYILEYLRTGRISKNLECTDELDFFGFKSREIIPARRQEITMVAYLSTGTA